MGEVKKVSLQTVRGAIPSLHELMKEETIPPKLRFQLARSIQKLDSMLQPLETALEGIKSPYIDKKTQIVKKENQEVFLKETVDFLRDTEVEVDLPDVPEKYVTNTKTSDILMLLPIMDFPEDEPEPESDSKKK